MDFQLVADSLPRLIAGIDETLVLALASLTAGFLLAIPIALMQLSGRTAPRIMARYYVYVFRSTPLLVQIFLIYYGTGQFRAELQEIGVWWLFRDAWFCAIFALTLNTAAYSSEIIRGGLMSVPAGQVEAARAVGMRGLTIFRRITFPIALRQALPAYGNEIILLIKATSLVSTITILEITAIAKKIITETYRPVEVFLVAGVLYLGINFIVTRIVARFETRLGRHRQPVSANSA